MFRDTVGWTRYDEKMAHQLMRHGDFRAPALSTAVAIGPAKLFCYSI